LQAIEDRRAAMAAWVLVNVNRDSKQKPDPFSFEEVARWLGTGYDRAPEAPQPSAPATQEDLVRNIEAIHLLHKGLYGENGSGQPGEG
jgi:hypothetical protein